MRFDVAIAGAGLAGATLALRLARAGVQVVVLDAHRFPREKLCGEYLSPEGVLALERLGLREDLQRLGGHPITRVRLSTPRGSVLDAVVGDREGCPGLGLSRTALDDLLVQKARAAGATVCEGHRVTGPRIDQGRVVGLAARDERHQSLTIRANVIVAADGRHSSLVRRTGRTHVRSWFRPALFGLKRHVRVPDPNLTEPEGTVGLHLVPGGYGGTCRIEGDATNFCALLPESWLQRHRGDLDRLAQDVMSRNPFLDRLDQAAEPLSPWKTVAGVRVEVSRPIVPGILYAGDCQGTVDPLGGQGMTMALLGAELLDSFVRDALSQGLAEPRLQLRYHHAWRTRFDRRIWLCRLYHHLLMHPLLLEGAAYLGPLANALVAAGFELTRDPGVRPVSSS
jgi:flavin-dependent dehydrogenase